MSVAIVTDSSSGLCPGESVAAGVTVLPLHVLPGDNRESTAGLSAIELAAAYGRAHALSGDAGIVALHLSRELSATWSAAVTAAGVFDGAVLVVDTEATGMALGAAAVVAADCAATGGSPQECADVAVATLRSTRSWFYVHSLDDIRRSGRMSAGQLMSTVLATRPILTLHEGRIDIAAKTRTRAKGLAKITDLIRASLTETPVFISLQHAAVREATVAFAESLLPLLPAGSLVDIRPLSAAVCAHTGPGAIGVSMVAGSPQAQVLIERFSQLETSLTA